MQPSPNESPRRLTVHGTRIHRDGKPFFMSGFNHWTATTLAREGDVPGWDQVRRDLDALEELGVNTIRTTAGAEGPDTEPWRIVPSIQPAEGVFHPAGVAGVVRVADELRRRGLHGIFVLTNFWPWSGGMAQYLSWAGQGPIPYPPPEPGGDWERYQEFTARFYENARALEAYRAYVRFLVPALRGNPAVVWELANEARGKKHVPAYRAWIDDSARLVKSLAPDQLVTTGSEGATASPAQAGLDVIEDHRSPAIDFVTCHLWAQNWGWVRPQTLAADFPEALDRARAYVRDHAALAARLGKPLLLEEFGFPRDEGSFDPRSTTRLRDRYFEEIYALVHSLRASTPLAGLMPWAWSGHARPPRPGGAWKPGDPLTGDPPHEAQGWYSIYTGDATLDVVRAWSRRVAADADAATDK